MKTMPILTFPHLNQILRWMSYRDQDYEYMLRSDYSSFSSASKWISVAIRTTQIAALYFTSESILTMLLHMKYIYKASHRKPLCSSLSVSEHQKLAKVRLCPRMYLPSRRINLYMSHKKITKSGERIIHPHASCLIRVWITAHLPQRWLLEHYLLCWVYVARFW